MEPHIRVITPAQFEESAKVIRESFQTVADEFGFTKENNPTNGAFIQASRLAEEHEKSIVSFGLYEENRQVGFMAVEKHDASVYYLEKLAVLPCCRHRGYGSLLMDHAQNYVRGQGGKQISIAIIEENTTLKKWYQAYGFRQTGLKTFEHLTFTVCFLSISVERKMDVRIYNTEQLPEEFIFEDSAGLVTKLLGAAGGSQKLYVNIDSVPPGAYSTKYHSHSQQEEFFFVLSGTGTLRLNGKESPVKPGDFFAKPAGQNIAHTFYNSGTEPLVILDAGTTETEDTCHYPDEDVYMQRSGGERRVFRGTDLVREWTSDPNERPAVSD